MTKNSLAFQFGSSLRANAKARKFAALSVAVLCSQLLLEPSLNAADNANRFLLADSYQPGQAIKLHDYSSHGNSSSSASSSSNTSSNSSSPAASPSSAGSAIDWHMPNSGPALTPAASINAPVQQNQTAAPKASAGDAIYFPSPEELSKMTSGGNLNSNSNSNSSSSTSPNSPETSSSNAAALQNTVHKPKSGWKQKMKHFAGDVVTEMVAPSGGGGTSGSNLVNIIPGIPHVSGGGGGYSGGGGGGGSEMANEIRLAQQAEAAGDYYQAAQKYWYSVDLAVGGKGYKERADFWVTGNVCGIPCKEIYRRSLRCHVIMFRAYLDTGKTWGLEPSICEHLGTDLFKDYTCLELCDPDNPAWYYLDALNAIGADDKELAHTRAFWSLGAALDCKTCSPELRKKCEVLREHIRLAALLELADENRAKFENMEAQVFGIEHPHTVVYKDSSGGVTHVITCAGGMYQYYYGFMKEMLKNDYPKFKANFARLQAYIASQPNHPVAIPPGDGAPDIVEFKQNQIEAKCYDVVVYRVGGHF